MIQTLPIALSCRRYRPDHKPSHTWGHYTHQGLIHSLQGLLKDIPHLTMGRPFLKKVRNFCIVQLDCSFSFKFSDSFLVVIKDICDLFVSLLVLLESVIKFDDFWIGENMIAQISIKLFSTCPNNRPNPNKTDKCIISNTTFGQRFLV